MDTMIIESITTLLKTETKKKLVPSFYNTFLEPGELEVSVHEGAVGVSVAEVAVVVLAVARHRHPPVGPDTN